MLLCQKQASPHIALSLQLHITHVLHFCALCRKHTRAQGVTVANV